ncbi:hypothetical protein CGCS363_v001340 [Colletotrichum siamense]|uniref:uncharacterized protein n=1 Tax=Colletotrichum siamense TaxID=690259 RepID=UPI0018721DBF|nr:uncharacterized protein CGCS363_v001340 [Colletotrichum siamense]KAF5517117.1 hypothetical protein CGCS363_v001340 [Colletotrichum siamense]
MECNHRRHRINSRSRDIKLKLNSNDMVLTTDPRSTTNNIRLPFPRSHHRSEAASNIGGNSLIVESHEIDSFVQLISSNPQSPLQARRYLFGGSVTQHGNLIKVGR